VPAGVARAGCLNGHNQQVRLCGTHALIVLTCLDGCPDARIAPKRNAGLALLQLWDVVLAGHAAGRSG